MRLITIAVPEEDVVALDALLQQSNITVLDEKDDNIEVLLYELESDEVETSLEEDLIIMRQLEKELDEEIWKLHHFA